jgi:hypothetical protein
MRQGVLRLGPKRPVRPHVSEADYPQQLIPYLQLVSANSLRALYSTFSLALSVKLSRAMARSTLSLGIASGSLFMTTYQVSDRARGVWMVRSDGD